MKDIQEVFDKLKEYSSEQKRIREEYKDTLFQTEGYEEVKEKIEELTTRKKEIEAIVQSRMGNRWNKLEDLKNEITKLKQMQSDIAMSTLIAGKNIQVKDEFDNVYEPKFNVTFKKTSAKEITPSEK
ncbi:MAG: hypothetical protein PHQ20_00985 [Candidatus Moranbacteria bacterium]|jgi:DNA repair exonuclease SbcCD ATPase subunit|nr:hypothetical protein [Candidatus Moranbacteria bacterium]